MAVVLVKECILTADGRTLEHDNWPCFPIEYIKISFFNGKALFGFEMVTIFNSKLSSCGLTLTRIVNSSKSDGLCELIKDNIGNVLGFTFAKRHVYLFLSLFCNGFILFCLKTPKPKV